MCVCVRAYVRVRVAVALALNQDALAKTLYALREGRPKSPGGPIWRRFDELLWADMRDLITFFDERGATQAAHWSNLHGAVRPATLKRPAAARPALKRPAGAFKRPASAIA